ELNSEEPALNDDPVLTIARESAHPIEERVADPSVLKEEAIADEVPVSTKEIVFRSPSQVELFRALQGEFSPGGLWSRQCAELVGVEARVADMGELPGRNFDLVGRSFWWNSIRLLSKRRAELLEIATAVAGRPVGQGELRRILAQMTVIAKQTVQS